MTDQALQSFEPQQLSTQMCEQAEQVLAQAKQLGVSGAEAYLSRSHGFTVSVRQQDLEQLECHTDQALTVTLYQGQRTGSASTTDLSVAGLAAVVEHANQIALQVGEDPCVGLADPALMAMDYPDCQLYHPWDVTVEQAVGLGKRLEQAGLAHDQQISQADSATVSTSQQQYVYANSHGFCGVVPSTSHSMSVMLVAGQAGELERDYDYSISCAPDQLSDPAAVAVNAAKRTVARLGAKSLSTRQCPVLFEARLARQFWGHFISAISGGALYRKASFLCDQLGQPIFARCVEIEEQPHLPGARGSAPFDGEGVRTQSRQLVAGGVLEGYVLSSYSARQLGMQTTANSGGVHNLIVKPTLPSDQLLARMGTGLLVTELLGHGVNLVTGDFSQGAFGYWVENGQIQYPVHGITVAGQLPQMFANVLAIGDDVDQRGNVQTGAVLVDGMTIAGHAS